MSGRLETDKLLEPTPDPAWVLAAEGYSQLHEGMYEARFTGGHLEPSYSTPRLRCCLNQLERRGRDSPHHPGMASGSMDENTL
jgi:hypothetical protein